MRARRLFLLLPLLISLGQAHAADLERGGQVYKLCAACHGENGQGNRELNAPAIAGIPSWYIESQLRKFKGGLRGYHADDVAALQMRPMARAVTTDDDLAAVAAYSAAMTPARPAPTVEGDPARGKVLYAPCFACHGGADGKGNKLLKSPSLIHQHDWYIVSQLKKFRDGLRGTHKDDATGAQMRAMLAALPDEQALNDVAAYIGTLGR
jgi:cytochrome c oxidase subunit 2